MLQRDVSSFFLNVCHRVDQAFYADMVDQGAINAGDEPAMSDDYNNSTSFEQQATAQGLELIIWRERYEVGPGG